MSILSPRVGEVARELIISGTTLDGGVPMSPHLRALKQTALTTMLGQWSDDSFWTVNPVGPRPERMAAQEAHPRKNGPIEPLNSGFAAVESIQSRSTGDADEIAETVQAECLAI
jgi:hypothetical protein